MQSREINAREQSLPPAELDVQRLTARFASIQDSGEFLRFSVRLINAAGAIIFRLGPEGVDLVEELLSRQALSWSASLRQELAISAHAAMSGNRTDCRCLESKPDAWIISCPFPSNDARPWCLTLLILIGSNPPEPFLVIAQLLASLLAPHRLTLTDSQPAGKSGGQQGLLDLLALVLGQAGQKEALLQFNASLKRWGGCSQVAIGAINATGQVELRSLSNVTSIDQRTDYTRLIAKVMRECAGRRAALFWPQEEGALAVSPILEEAAAVTKVQQCMALPVGLPDGDLVGALVLLWEERGDRSMVVDALTRTNPLLAGILTGLFRPHSAWHVLSGSQTTEPFGLGRATLALVACALLVLLNLMPIPFRIRADCVTQPVSIRAIVSRFDGILKEVVVQPGDQVQEGAVLARLDGKEADLQLGSVTAERDKAAKMRDQYLAAGETALAQISRLDSLRFEEQINLIREKQDHLVLTSPITGVVLSGDLKRAVGGPVTRGQTLFEVAPLESIHVELAIPEKDIAYVRNGSEVTVRFTAFPGISWQGVIEHIVPKSQIRGTMNVFLARIQFDNTNALLRPGMRGESKISAGWRTIGWQLFRTPWHTLRRLADQVW